MKFSSAVLASALCFVPLAIADDIATIAATNGNFDTLVAALSAAELVSVFQGTGDNYTVFAPTDAAFDALPDRLLECLLDDIPTLSQILQYHVVSGSVFSTDLEDGTTTADTLLNNTSLEIVKNGTDVAVNGVPVDTPDIPADNGVIHVIGSVLVPPMVDIEGYLAECPVDDIPTVAANAGTFSTLLTALTAADLASVLSYPNGPFTVFAPDDEAFGDLPEGLVGCLLADTDVLARILLYHVVGDSVASSDLEDGQMVETLDGMNVTVSIDGDMIMINNANVTAADVNATNGIIHVIDAVLVPSDIDVEGFLTVCLETEEPTSSPTAAPTAAPTSSPVSDGTTSSPTSSPVADTASAANLPLIGTTLTMVGVGCTLLGLMI